MKANHILVDFENVQKLQFDLIGDTSVAIHLFVGEKQGTVSISLLEDLLALRPTCTIKLIRAKATGKNSLDFVLATTLGQLISAEPEGYFHILSKDKGYNASVDHFRDQGFHVARHDSLASIPIFRTKVHTTPEARAETYRAHLPPEIAKRPQGLKALQSAIDAYFGKQLTPEELEAVVTHLRKAGALIISEAGKVTYTDGKGPTANS